MAKNYAYRMDHDTGFAPNLDFGLCTLSGCKTNTVERWAEKGSWVIGIGGRGTNQSDRLIYAMNVEENLTYPAFATRYPRKSQYLREKSVKSVLVSRRYFYFGDSAIDLPTELRHLIIERQGCIRVSDTDVSQLEKYLLSNFGYGVHGKPNNPNPRSYRSGCQCSIRK